MKTATKTKQKNEILDQSLAFSLRLIRTLGKIPKNDTNRILVRQVIRSGTSIGANVEEAVGASAKKEFIRCMIISRKEARETRYWLRLLVATNPDSRDTPSHLGEKVTDLLKILNKIISTSKKY